MREAMLEYIACDLCGSSDYEEYKTHACGFGVTRCRNCGLIYNNPRPSYGGLLRLAAEDQWARHSPEVLKRLRIDFYKIMFDELRHYKSGGKLLDIGCGYGFMLELASDRDYEVFGVELQDSMAKYAREQLGLKVVTGELFDANYPDNFFDVITMWSLLSHVPSPSKVLRETRRILKDEGVLNIVDCNVEGCGVRTDPYEWQPFHFYHFSLTTLNKMLSTNGFAISKLMINPSGSFIKSIRRRQFIYQHLGWLFRAFRKITPYLYHLPIYRCNSGSITIYARKSLEG